MFQKTKLNKSYLSAIGMALVLLFINTLGIFIQTRIGQITPPLQNDSWADYAVSSLVGAGTEADPYRINSAEELAYFSKNSVFGGAGGTKCISIDADIDLSAHSWTSFVSATSMGQGFNIQGNGHTISNMNGTPLIGSGYYTIIVSGLNFLRPYIIGGGVLGVSTSSAVNLTIDNVNITAGLIQGTNGVGGLVGSAAGGQTNISNCVVDAHIIGTNRVGGIVASKGSSTPLNITNCVFVGQVSGEQDVGGILGYGTGVGNQCKIEDCLAEATITGSKNVGGIAGVGCATITRSGFQGEIKFSGDTSTVGAMAGVSSSGTITSSFAVADISIQDNSVEPFDFGVDKSIYSMKSSYSYSKIIKPSGIIEKRKYMIGSDEIEPFSEMAVHKNINGGYPFPKSLFAVGQFIESDVMGYLEEYGFSKFNYPLYKKGDRYYVELGEYPQTYVGDSLNATLKSWYTSNNPSSVDSYTNDKGTSADTITHYAYSYNGNKYVRVISSVMQGSYKTQDESTTLMPNQEYWFKVEPIKWWVLNYTDVQNGANPIVLAEQGLTANVTWNKSTSDQNLWASKSNIRTWLNSTFYNDAFSEVKDDIQTTTVKNNSSSSYTDGSGTSTQDNVWLLSYGEAGGGTAGQYSENRYFNDNPSRLCSPTDYALVNNCYMNVNASYPTEIRKNGGSCDWWLRSAHTSYTFYAQYVSYNGSLSSTNVYYYNSAVRPALTLNF